MISNAVINQAMLSAASFIVNLILIRRTTDQQYGLYILVTTGLLLMTSLQTSFFSPAIVSRMTRLDAPGRSDLVGGLFREQRRLLGIGASVLGLIMLALWAGGRLDHITGPVALCALAAAAGTANREYLRLVLLAYKRSQDVLTSDVFYVGMLIAGALLATFTELPAAAAAIGLAVANFAGGRVLSRKLHRHEPYNTRGAPGILREIAPLASWSTTGAAIHWLFSQGYSYLVAGTLDVTAVAALGATRMLLMPINLLSAGVGSLMLPVATGWLMQHGAGGAFRRLLAFAIGIACVALTYIGVLWLLRDWLFDTILHKHFAQRDQLLLLWSAACVSMVVRDQLIFLPVACERFKILAGLAFASALVSLSISYFSMLRIGVSGALIGVLCGEIVSISGIIFLSLREVGRMTAQTREPVPA
jgi:O-antigen/teichoic acid export membrane protein